MADGKLGENAPRVYERWGRVKQVIDDATEKLKEHYPFNYWAVFFYHDLGSDARMLTEWAGRWEDHCRKTGQHPFAWTNEDGTVDKSRGHNLW